MSQLQADGTRRLYVAGGTAVSFYTLLNGGGLDGEFAVLNGSFSASCEAELSADGSTIAWATLMTTPNPTVSVYRFGSSNTPTTFVPNFKSRAANGISGLEFSSNSDKLFIMGSAFMLIERPNKAPKDSLVGGAAVYTMATQQQSSISTVSTSTGKLLPLATNSQIELAFDGLLYAASGKVDTLLTLNPGTLVFSLSPLKVTNTYLYSPSLGGTVYGFPDQIDGENYTSYFGNYAPTVSASPSVDGQILLPASFRNVYGCKPMNLTATLSPNVSRLDVIIRSTDVNGVPTTAYSYTYTTTSGLPLSLASLNSGYLADPAHAGYYQLQLIGYNPCGQTAQSTVRMQVSNLTAASAGFAFNVCTGTGPQASNTSLGNPASLGASSGGGIDISFSTGDYDSYQVQFARYVPGTNPAQYQVIGTTPSIPKPATGSGLSSIFLSYLSGQAGLSTGYFLYNNGNPGPGYNQPHQLILTVSNACGTSPALTGYFQTSNFACRPASAPTVSAAAPELFPNPLSGSETSQLRFVLPSAQPVSLVLTDALTGQVRLSVLRDANRPAGAQEVTIDARHLPAGVYLYHLKTATGTQVGRLLKAE